MTEKSVEKGPKLAEVPSSLVSSENLTASKNIEKFEEMEVPIPDRVPTPEKFPVLVHDYPGGLELAWNGATKTWETWEGKVSPYRKDLLDVSYLPVEATYLGYVRKDGIFFIVDLKMHGRKTTLRVQQSRQASMTILKQVFPVLGNHKHEFLFSEEVSDAQGFESIQSRIKNPRILR